MVLIVILFFLSNSVLEIFWNAVWTVYFNAIDESLDGTITSGCRVKKVPFMN